MRDRLFTAQICKIACPQLKFTTVLILLSILCCLAVFCYCTPAMATENNASVVSKFPPSNNGVSPPMLIPVSVGGNTIRQGAPRRLKLA